MSQPTRFFPSLRCLPVLCALSGLLLLLPGSAVLAGDADVIDVQIKRLGNNRYQIDVTVRHEDEGWDHYANRWDVLNQDGELLGSRILAHPHVNEQPFTRSLSITIAETVKEITLRANDSVHESGGQSMTIPLPQH